MVAEGCPPQSWALQGLDSSAESGSEGGECNETMNVWADERIPEPSPQPQRRLIKADINFSLDSQDDYDDDDEVEETGKEETFFYGHICPDGSQSVPSSPVRITNAPKGVLKWVGLRRRHSICSPGDKGAKTIITFPFEYTTSESFLKALEAPRATPSPQRRMVNSISRDFLASEEWKSAICLSLTLEEVIHIRNVLTKAELEALPLECTLKHDVERGKLCFLCLRTKFHLFGPWGKTCKLCKRIVCAKCCSKMRLPLEHLGSVPVSTLSPCSSPEDFPNSVGSAPSSPKTPQKNPGEKEDELKELSFSSVASISLSINKMKSFGKKGNDSTLKTCYTETVCSDCRAMLLQVIRSSRKKIRPFTKVNNWKRGRN